MNRPLPSSRLPLYQNEVKCSAFDMKMIVHSDANKTHFHKKGCVLGLNLKVRVFGTRKWPISMVSAVFCSLGLPVIYLAHREQYDMVYHHNDAFSINNVVFEFNSARLSSLVLSSFPLQVTSH